MANKTTERLQASIAEGLKANGHKTSLDKIVSEGRKNGQSWNDLAIDVYVMSGIRITGQTLNNWDCYKVVAA